MDIEAYFENFYKKCNEIKRNDISVQVKTALELLGKRDINMQSFLEIFEKAKEQLFASVAKQKNKPQKKKKKKRATTLQYIPKPLQEPLRLSCKIIEDPPLRRYNLTEDAVEMIKKATKIYLGLLVDDIVKMAALKRERPQQDIHRLTSYPKHTYDVLEMNEYHKRQRHEEEEEHQRESIEKRHQHEKFQSMNDFATSLLVKPKTIRKRAKITPVPPPSNIMETLVVTPELLQQALLLRRRPVPNVARWKNNGCLGLLPY